MSNPTGKGGFQDRKAHINRKGRPKSFDAARALAQQIAHEIAKVKDKDNPDNEIELVIDDHYVTVTEAILRSWANSGDPKLSTAFMEWAYGKVPNVTEVTGKDGKDLPVLVIAPGMLDKLKP